jgi:hypothetical protein
MPSTIYPIKSSPRKYRTVLPDEKLIAEELERSQIELRERRLRLTQEQ